MDNELGFTDGKTGKEAEEEMKRQGIDPNYENMLADVGIKAQPFSDEWICQNVGCAVALNKVNEACRYADRRACPLYQSATFTLKALALLEPPKDQVEAVKKILGKYYPDKLSQYCPDPPTLGEPDRPIRCPNDCNDCLAREICQAFVVKLPKIKIESHSRGYGCPHCGEEFGLEDYAEAEQETYKGAIRQANPGIVFKEE